MDRMKPGFSSIRSILFIPSMDFFCAALRPVSRATPMLHRRKTEAKVLELALPLAPAEK
jgi:hypothetical protein